jgi:hypothetical protein
MLDLPAGQIRPLKPFGDDPVEARTLEGGKPVLALLRAFGGPGDVAPLPFCDKLRQSLPTNPGRLAHH